MGQELLVVAEQAIVNRLSMNQQLGTVQTIVASGTINTNYGSVRVSAAGAIAGVILQPGVTPGQRCVIIIESAAANTFTMAASGTSNAAGGVTYVWAGLEAHEVVWNSTTALWYVVGPAAN